MTNKSFELKFDTAWPDLPIDTQEYENGDYTGFEEFYEYYRTIYNSNSTFWVLIEYTVNYQFYERMCEYVEGKINGKNEH